MIFLLVKSATSDNFLRYSSVQYLLPQELRLSIFIIVALFFV